MTTTAAWRRVRRVTSLARAAHGWLMACALVAATGVPRAAERAPASAPPSDVAPREVVLALGYGSIVAPRGLEVARSPENIERVAAFDGFSIDVTRRIPRFEVGARFWRAGSTDTDGQGGAAHVLTRLTTEARYYPSGWRTVEPWIGAELGLALADDFALWNATDKEPAHRAVAGARPGLVAGLEAGVRLRLASLLALGLRGGLSYMGFDRVTGPVAESPRAAKFSVLPIDYGQRVWLSAALTLELTVPD